MTGFYVMSACWVFTLLAWQFREHHHAKERMEMLKLFRAHSLTDFNAQESQVPRPGNFIQASIKRAYSERHLGNDDDE